MLFPVSHNQGNERGLSQNTIDRIVKKSQEVGVNSMTDDELLAAVSDNCPVGRFFESLCCSCGSSSYELGDQEKLVLASQFLEELKALKEGDEKIELRGVGRTGVDTTMTITNQATGIHLKIGLSCPVRIHDGTLQGLKGMEYRPSSTSHQQTNTYASSTTATATTCSVSKEEIENREKARAYAADKFLEQGGKHVELVVLLKAYDQKVFEETGYRRPSKYEEGSMEQLVHDLEILGMANQMDKTHELNQYINAMNGKGFGSNRNATRPIGKLAALSNNVETTELLAKQNREKAEAINNADKPKKGKTLSLNRVKHKVKKEWKEVRK